MRFLVDELPLYKDDCMFAESRWDDDEETWVTYCKFNDERCDLYTDGLECSFLKEQGE